MSRLQILAVLTLLLAACSRGGDPGAPAAAPPDDGFADLRERASYVFGIELGARLINGRDEIDLVYFQQGLEDVFAGAELKLEQEEAAELMRAFTQRMQQRAMAQRQEEAERNLREGEAFLAENGERPDVMVTESGLQYRVLRAGSGARPQTRNRVRVHYEGRLLDGTVFDSSIARGEPAEFALSGVIQGWVEALQLMPVGSRYELFVPSRLGYREQGSGQIGPNATLIFEVELLDIIN